MILDIQGLRKNYVQGVNSIEILKGLDLQLGAKESAAVMGPSGCGKSTLLSIISGLEVANGGVVKINGQNLFDFRPDELVSFRARNVGIVFQQFHLLPHLTAAENVRLPIDLRADSINDKSVANALERVGLSKRHHHYPHQLSRGECQRVAIARVLVMGAPLIIADEPTASLDSENAEIVFKLLFDLCEETGISLLMATHDRKIADRCQTIYRLEDGLLNRINQHAA